MAEVTRTNGGVGVEGVINGIASTQLGHSLAFYNIIVKNVGAVAQDLRPEMAAGINGGLGLAVEAILRVCPPALAYSVVNDNSGSINLICDGHAAPTAAQLQTTIQALGTSVGTNTMDVSGSAVTLGSTFVIA